MADDLVKRLRDFDPHNMHEWEAVDLAADRIEQLERDLKEDALKQALAELGDVVRCRCDEAYRDRGLHDPQCQCDSMDAVRVVIARIDWLERERVLDAKLLADTQALLDKAEVVMREAADRIQQLGRERDAAIAALTAERDDARKEAGIQMRHLKVLADKLAPAEAERDALRERVARLEGALVEHNDLLRSALSIAKREGVDGEIASTNWDAYYNRVAVVLKRHHQTANDARAALTDGGKDG